MSRGTQKSKWVETEIERGGEVYLLPIRCLMEARRDRLRTVIQTYSPPSTEWVESHRTAWVSSAKAERLTEAQLDQAAEEVADTLTEALETGPLHPDWRMS